ncbi:MAG: hypothetical protein CMK32_03565 [Porticoccaceae bacterium]|nr:hypothetical protein [Porticoccaceae bacterium]
MDRQLFFTLGDVVANLFVGFVMAAVAWLLVGTGWNMLIAMVAMMVLGMGLAVFLWFPIGIVLGAMEAMVPMMLTGMLSGMVVGMTAAMSSLSFSDASWKGLISGFVCFAFVWVMNSRLRGPQAL